MAKRGRRKKKNSVNAGILGVIFVLVGVIGLGVFGPVGTYIKAGAVFFFGNYFNILIIELIALGIYMIVQGSLPNFLSTRLVGLYLIVISFLVFMNIKYLNMTLDFSHQFEGFINTYNTVVSNSFTGISEIGSGAFGLLMSFAFVKALSVAGTYALLVVFMLFAIMFIFDFSIADLVEAIKNGLSESEEERAERLDKKRKAKEEKEERRLEKMKEKEEKRLSKMIPEEEEEEDNGIVINSAEELKKFHNDQQANVPQTPVEEVPIINLNSDYKLPELDQVLNRVTGKKNGENPEVLKQTSKNLVNALADFQVEAQVVNMNIGPTVTQFELHVKNGTKISKITGLSKEIALALGAKDVRIEAPIPGKTSVGIEIPNRNPVGVPIREVIERRRKEMIDPNMKLPVSLGKDINGVPMIFDLSKTPHLLVAGSTGSGKSVCINSFIASLLINKRPDEVKLILVDPKKVELSNYNGVPHLYCPVVTDPKKASVALQNVVKEMENRYLTFEEEKVKNITGYNEKIEKLMKSNPEENYHKMPYWLVIIDELADLMLVASKEVEDSIMRITQMARAAGIHLIVATQRPSTDVITGVVKANIPSRISFAVASQIDSRTILDCGGAEKLLGKGDMLFKPMGQNNPTRIQGNFISDEEIERVISYVTKQQKVQYNENFTTASSAGGFGVNNGGSTSGGAEDDDPLYNEIVDYCIQSGKVSASLLQRKFRLGYNRAARIVDILEERGIIGPQNGSKPREVLIKMKHEDEEE